MNVKSDTLAMAFYPNARGFAYVIFEGPIFLRRLGRKRGAASAWAIGHVHAPSWRRYRSQSSGRAGAEGYGQRPESVVA